MKLLAGLSQAILAQSSFNLERENITSYADNGQLIPAVRDLGNGIEVARFSYDAVIQIERFAGDASDFSAMVISWIMDNDDDRETFSLDDPQLQVEYNDVNTVDLELVVMFNESVQLVPDPDGDIQFRGETWTTSTISIDTAEHLDGLHGLATKGGDEI